MEKKRSYHHGDLKNALIQSGIEILAAEGFHELSLRKAARLAGVSHSAPYAHFTDKQSLVAAISTEGFQSLYGCLSTAVNQYQNDPERLLVESAWRYTSFALENSAQFKIMLSGVIETENEFPALRAISSQCSQLLEQIAAICQNGGLLKPGPVDLMAITLWSLTHGFVSLILERQIPIPDQNISNIKRMLIEVINQITMIHLKPSDFQSLT